MKKIVWIGFLVAASAALAAGCSRARRAEHAAERSAPEAVPPTPDTTPIAALRTPAGLVLGVEGTPAAATPSPAGTAVVPAATTTPLP